MNNCVGQPKENIFLKNLKKTLDKKTPVCYYYVVINTR